MTLPDLTAALLDKLPAIESNNEYGPAIEPEVMRHRIARVLADCVAWAEEETLYVERSSGIYYQYLGNLSDDPDVWVVPTLDDYPQVNEIVHVMTDDPEDELYHPLQVVDLVGDRFEMNNQLIEQLVNNLDVYIHSNHLFSHEYLLGLYYPRKAPDTDDFFESIHRNVVCLTSLRDLIFGKS